MRVYYEILGVGERATDQEIRRAFRRLALKYHPDVNGDAEAEERFKEIYEAYQALLEIVKPSRQTAEQEDRPSRQTGDREDKCEMCMGAGEFIAYWTSIPGGESMRCPQCLGSGREPPSTGRVNHTPLNCKCEDCNRRWAEWKRRGRPSSARSGGIVTEAEEFLGEYATRPSKPEPPRPSENVPRSSPSPSKRRRNTQDSASEHSPHPSKDAPQRSTRPPSERRSATPTEDAQVAAGTDTSPSTPPPTRHPPSSQSGGGGSGWKYLAIVLGVALAAIVAWVFFSGQDSDPVATFTPVAVVTNIDTSTPTHTPSPTATQTSTNTPVATVTHAPTRIPTETPVPTATPTRTATRTRTRTPTSTATPTLIPTKTPTPVPTVTPTRTPTPTATPTLVPTATPTPVPTATSTHVPTSTPTPVPTPSPTPTPTPTSTPTPTFSPTSTPTPDLEATAVSAAQTVVASAFQDRHPATATNTPTATHTNTPTPTLVPTSIPTSVAPSVTPTTDRSTLGPSPALKHLEQKQFMLTLINAEREKAGVDPVVLGDNIAAQVHADSSLENCVGSHWGIDGLKPYMRYSLAGGYQSNGENWSGSDFCITESTRSSQGFSYRPIEDVREKVRQTMEGWMNSPGHRRNILRKWHKKVNIGLAWDRYNFSAAQHFEGDYVEYYGLPVFENGVLVMSGRVRHGVTFEEESDLGVQIYFDPPPYGLTRGQVSRTYCYNYGRQVAGLRPPLRGNWFYPENEFTKSYKPCPNPYDIRPDAPVPRSPEEAHAFWQAAYDASQARVGKLITVPWITAQEWSISEFEIQNNQWVEKKGVFSVKADIADVLMEHGEGVYSLIVWGSIGDERLVISEYAIFHGLTPPDTYSPTETQPQE